MYRRQQPHNMINDKPYNRHGIRPVQQYFPRRHNPSFRAPFNWNNQAPNRFGRRFETDLRGGDEHWCETCDRGFPTLDLLEKHKLQHQKCNIDGCQFVAHPKVITKHIQMQHSTGLYKKIGKLDNPEAINKWREERKKKYPTKQNIDKKVAELKEKVDRGEKMGLQPDRINRNTNSMQGEAKRKYNIANNHRQDQVNFKKKNLNSIYKKPKRVLKSVPEIDKKSRLVPFTGIQNIVMDCDVEEMEERSQCNFLIEDDDCESTTTITTKTENLNDPVMCGALSSLICEYGSSDEEIDKQLTSTEKSQPIKTLDIVPNEMTVNKNNAAPKSDEDSGPEEVTNNKSDRQTTDDDKSERQTTKDKGKLGILKKKNQNVYQCKVSRPKPKLPSTLLHKLLFKEMRQERNIVLQCIRYIREKKYFR